MVRYKNRYILVQIKSEKNLKLTIAEVATEFKRNIQKFYGDFGSALTSNFSVKYFNEKHRLVIARLAHGPHKYLASILPLLTKAGKELARFRIIYIGASIRQCKKYIIKHQNELLRQLIATFHDEKERQDFLNNLVSQL